MEHMSVYGNSIKKDIFTGHLMSGDIPVLLIESNIIKEVLCPSKLPLYFRINSKTLVDTSIDNWLLSRYVDKSRTNFRKIYKALKLNSEDLVNIIKYKAFSVSDNYWIKSLNDTCTYPDLLLDSKRNSISDVALSGKDLDNAVITVTPELSNLGTYEKCWVHLNNEWYMKKQGGFTQAGSNLAESISFRISTHLGIPCAEYDLTDGGAYCITKNIADSVNLEPWGTVYRSDDNLDTDFILSKLSDIDKKRYLNMKYLDALILNSDRHEFNFALTTDRGTGEIVGLSKIYDNNMALCGQERVGNKSSICTSVKFDAKELSAYGVSYKSISDSTIINIVNSECSKLDSLEYQFALKRCNTHLTDKFDSLEDYIIYMLTTSNRILKEML